MGTKRVVVAIGAAFDTQDQYRAYDADVVVDHSIGSGAISAQFAWPTMSALAISLPLKDTGTSDKVGWVGRLVTTSINRLPVEALATVVSMRGRDSVSPFYRSRSDGLS